MLSCKERSTTPSNQVSSDPPIRRTDYLKSNEDLNDSDDCT